MLLLLHGEDGGDNSQQGFSRALLKFLSVTAGLRACSSLPMLPSEGEASLSVHGSWLMAQGQQGLCDENNHMIDGVEGRQEVHFHLGSDTSHGPVMAEHP